MNLLDEATITDGTFLQRLFRTMEADNVQFHIVEPVGENETVIGKMNLLERSLHTILRETVKEEKENTERLKVAKTEEESLQLLKKDDCIRWQRFSADALLNESIWKRFPDYSELSLRAPNVIVTMTPK